MALPAPGALGAGLRHAPGTPARELVLAGITDMAAANAYLQDIYLPAFNAEFAHPSREEGSAFVRCPASVNLDDILCQQVPRTVGKANCVQLDGLVLQIPAYRHRYHYIKARVTVSRHMDGTLSVFHGPRQLARYDAQGQLIQDDKSSGQTICTAAAARRVAPKDGRNELPTAA